MMKAFFKEIENFIFVEDPPAPSDIIFIPGSPQPDTALKAARLYHEGYAPLIMPSGRYSVTKEGFELAEEYRDLYPGSYQTEWAFMLDVLTKAHVPREAVLKEDMAAFTWQNALFSREMADRAGLKLKSAILCCKTWHARRCLSYYQRAFPEVTFRVCPCAPDGITRENWRCTPVGIQAVTEEVGRIVYQFSLLMDEPEPPE